MFGWLIRCVGHGVMVCVGAWLAFEFSFSFLFVKTICPGGWIGGRCLVRICGWPYGLCVCFWCVLCLGSVGVVVNN